MTQTTRPTNADTYDTLKRQLQSPGGFKDSNLVFKQIKEFFIDQTQQLPDMTIEQISELLEMLKDVTAKSKTEFKQLLLKLWPIIGSAQSSEIKLKDGTSIYRMCNKEFESLLKNLKTNKTAKIFEELQEPTYNISIEQLRQIAQCYTYETPNKRIIIEKIKWIEENMIVKEKSTKLSDEELSLYLSNNIPINKINQVFQKVKDNAQKRTKIEPKCDLTFLHQKLGQVLIQKFNMKSNLNYKSQLIRVI